MTNLVNEWSRGLGFAIADDLRELSVTMKKVGINADPKNTDALNGKKQALARFKQSKNNNVSVIIIF